MLQYHSIFLFNSWWAALQGKEGLFLVKIHAFSTNNSNYTPTHLKHDSRQCCFYSIHSTGASSLYFLCFWTAWTYVNWQQYSSALVDRLRDGPAVSLRAHTWPQLEACWSALAVRRWKVPFPAFLAGKYSSQTELGRLLSGWQLDMWGDILSWFQQWMPNAGHHSAPHRTHRNHTSLSVTSIFIYASCARSFSLFSLPWKLSPGMSGGLSGGVVTLPLKFLIV